jgi:putative flavoprotein involved in K+ transport
MSYTFDTIVIGAGQAGLATGYHLRRAGLEFVILEGEAQPGGSWPRYYDSLTLFSPARRSSLPGMPFPADRNYYAARDEVTAYLRQYAGHFQLPIITNARVVRVEQEAEGFRVITQQGASYHGRSVIAATGAFHRPHTPQIPGQDSFQGQMLHSATYRHPAPFQDQRVVVVGAGNSAIQIGVELAQLAHVTLATRQPIRFRPQQLLGRDIHHWARLLGLDRLPLGPWLAGKTMHGVLDTGVYQAAIAAGQPDRRQMFVRFTPSGIVWADGVEEPIDAVIYATGYVPNLDYLSALGALDADGQALHRRGVSTTVPRLAYVGLHNQWTYASATLRGVGPDAAYVVRALRRQLCVTISESSGSIGLRERIALSTGCCARQEAHDDDRKRTALGDLQRPTASVHPPAGGGSPQRRRYLAGCVPQNPYPYRHTAHAGAVDQLDLPDHAQRHRRLLSSTATHRRTR